MFSQRIYGCEKPEVKRGALPIDFLCNIKVYGMPLISKTLILMNDTMQMIDECLGF